MLAFVLLLGLAVTAQARQFQMFGAWHSQRGVLVRVPLGGDVPGQGVVSAMGASPATLTVPKSLFKRPAPSPSNAIAVTTLPTVIQFATALSFTGPVNTGVFRKSDWKNQAGRAKASFTWCPGAPGNPTCPNVNSTIHGGTDNGLVRYKAGKNAFGGTMQLFAGGAGALSVKAGMTPQGGQLVGHNQAGGGTNPSAVGGGYSYINFNIVPAGPVTLNPGYSAGGLIQTNGPVVGSIPATTVKNWGFAFTTGSVFVSQTGTAQGQPNSTTLSAMGTDQRNASGAGNITLVAGGLSTRVNQPTQFGSTSTVVMQIGGVAVPVLSPVGIAFMALGLLATMAYLMRRRRATA